MTKTMKSNIQWHKIQRNLTLQTILSFGVWEWRMINAMMQNEEKKHCKKLLFSLHWMQQRALLQLLTFIFKSETLLFCKCFGSFPTNCNRSKDSLNMYAWNKLKNCSCICFLHLRDKYCQKQLSFRIPSQLVILMIWTSFTKIWVRHDRYPILPNGTRWNNIWLYEWWL